MGGFHIGLLHPDHIAMLKLFFSQDFVINTFFTCNSLLLTYKTLFFAYKNIFLVIKIIIFNLQS